MANTLPVSSVVSVSVEMSPTAAALRNFGAALIIGSSDVIDTDERIRLYSSIDEVAEDFGTTAREYLAAQAFFSQSPQPKFVYVGRWAQSATAGRLRGRVLSTDEQDMAIFNAITAGTMTLLIDGTEKTISDLNLSSETNLNGIASMVTTALGDAGTCFWSGTQFVITSATTGSSSTVAVTDSDTLSSAMGFTSGTTSIVGVAAETLTDALTTFLDDNSWYMCVVAADTDDASKVAAAGIIEAASPSRLIAFTDQSTDNIDPTKSGTLGDQLKELSYNHSLVMYSSESPVAAASILGRMATVNFEGSNTALTLKFKQCPGVTPEYLKTSQATALAGRNVNVFAAYQNDTAILQEGKMSGGWFIDERHNLDWLSNRVATDAWNLLYTSKKVGQDESGSTALVACLTKSLEQAVTNGILAPGVWNGDSFGALKTGDTLSTGYYIYIQPFSEQSQSDREARKAPAIQIAAKLKGAIHSVDVTITVNR
jgi:hypothetical protein